MKTIGIVFILSTAMFTIGCYTQLATSSDDAETLAIAYEPVVGYQPDIIVVIPVYVPVAPPHCPIISPYYPPSAGGVSSPQTETQSDDKSRDIGNHRGPSGSGTGPRNPSPSRGGR